MNYLKKANIAVNMLFIVAAAIGATLLIKHYFFRTASVPQNISPAKPNLAASQNLSVGNKLEVPGLSWSQNGSLVLALSTGCSFCQDSAPFYQQLMSALANQKQVKTVALLPQPVNVSQEYLDKNLHIHVDETVQASLPSIGIAGTPTLLLVDNNGIIKNLWLGKLRPQQESEVFRRLHDLANITVPESANEKQSSMSSASRDLLTTNELNHLKNRSSQNFIVLDIRNRQEYKAGHPADAKNIPFDEIEVRAPDELPRGSLIILFCRCQEGDPTLRGAQKILASYGYRTKILKDENSDHQP